MEYSVTPKLTVKTWHLGQKAFDQCEDYQSYLECRIPKPALEF